MTIFEAIIVLGVFFALVGAHQAVTKLVNVLDGHLERLQAKLDVLMAAQCEHNDKIDIILGKLL